MPPALSEESRKRSGHVSESLADRVKTHPSAAATHRRRNEPGLFLRQAGAAEAFRHKGGTFARVASRHVAHNAGDGRLGMYFAQHAQISVVSRERHSCFASIR